ncbi:MAG TPA: zinc ribbon domain-containing protein [Thermoplasmata archaeon]|nr:zinc ribbon domain-containing protein [Thermoplasmata archaeon]
MAGNEGEQLCPICDSPLQPGSKKCGFCGTDLTIFDIESEAPKETPEETPKGAPKEEPEVSPAAAEVDEPDDTKVETVFFGESDAAEAAAPGIESVTGETPEPQAEPESGSEPAPESEPEVEVEPTEVKEESQPDTESVAEAEPTSAESYFECPECSGRVEASAKTCPSCGVMFADEGVDMFQCPACSTLVKVDATSCSRCGAMFVESEEELAQTQPAVRASPSEVPEPKVELEVAVSEVVMEPEEGTDVEAAEAGDEPDKKGLFGGLFGKRKRKRQPADDEGIPGQRIEFPSILGRARRGAEEPAEVEPEMEPVEAEPVEAEPVEVEPDIEPEPEFKPGPEPAPVVAPAPERVQPPVRDKTKGRELARLTAEIQPLMRLAIGKGVDVSKSRKLVDEGAMSVRAREMDRALESVRQARETLLESLQDSVGQVIADLRAEAKVAKVLGGDVSRANAYLDELEKAGKTGDYEAMYVYADKVKNELLPITGRYNESKQKISSLRTLVSDSEIINADTKEVRVMLAEASKSFESNDFDKVDLTVRSATDKLYAGIEPRLGEEIRRARDQLVDLKEHGQNITPMITVLKSARTMMKSKDYPQALKEMREFKDQVRKAQ